MPQFSSQQIIDMPLGARDRLLMQLRERLFGPQVHLLADCPQCSETCEVDFRSDDVIAEKATPGATFLVDLDHGTAEFRLPTSRDIAAVASIPPPQRGAEIISACLTEMSRSTDLTPADYQRISDAMAKHDPHADVRLDLVCVACQHHWTAPFDILSLLWREVNARCQKLLAEIHVLAKAYGWSERDVLSLSRWRREVYLNMVRQ